MSREADEPGMWFVNLARTATDREQTRTIVVDARTAAVLGEPRFDEGFMGLMLNLHIDLFAGLPGTLFLGLMGLLLVLAIASGVVLYAPFMRKLDFGSVRRDRSPRVRWLDLHNLLGIVTLVWAGVVGLTGVINTLGEPVIKLWQLDQMAQMLAPYANKPVAAQRASLQASVHAAQAAEPSMRLGFVAFPGTDFRASTTTRCSCRASSAHGAPVKPVLVDASTATVTDSRELPWYVTALLISQPLHFGDYGGLPMKVIWALLDLATITVLGSGLYLWIARRQPSSMAEEEAGGEGAAA